MYSRSKNRLASLFSKSGPTKSIENKKKVGFHSPYFDTNPFNTVINKPTTLHPYLSIYLHPKIKANIGTTVDPCFGL